MDEVIQKLCAYIGVRKDTIVFQIDTPPRGGLNYTATLTRTSHGNNTVPVFISTHNTTDPVVDAVMKKLIDNLRQLKYTPLEDTDVFFFDDMGLENYSSSVFSRLIYRSACYEMFDNYGELLNIDFELIADIMSEPYENKQPKGTLAFINNSVDSVLYKTVLRAKFLTPDFDVLNLKGKKYIRKMLEGAGDDILVFLYDPSCEGGAYRCIGYADKKYLEFFSCHFSALGRNSWSFTFLGQTIFKVRSGNIIATEDDLGACLRLLENEIGASSVNKLIDAIVKIAEQKHGTSVIFIDSSQRLVNRHIKRLADKQRAIRVKGISVVKGSKAAESKYEELTKIAAMDGAIIIDYHIGEVVYINAIVDGLAIVLGDPSGGARRNGLSCFIANLVSECHSARVAALIFSEDGGCKIVRGSDFREICLRNRRAKQEIVSTQEPINQGNRRTPKTCRHVKYRRRAPPHF